jgi:hypothetical protein
MTTDHLTWPIIGGCRMRCWSSLYSLYGFSLWLSGAADHFGNQEDLTPAELTEAIITVTASLDTDSMRLAPTEKLLRTVGRSIGLKAEWYRAAKMIRAHLAGEAVAIKKDADAVKGSRHQRAAAKATRADALTSAIQEMLEADPAMTERKVWLALRKIPEFKVTEDTITYIPRTGATSISVKTKALKDRIHKARRKVAPTG